MPLFFPSAGTRLNSIAGRYHFNIRETEVSEPGDILCQVEDCDALFVVSVALPAVVVDGLSHCRVISRLGVGTDKIDVRKATEKGILITNIPDFCVEEQADHTMALVLGLVSFGHSARAVARRATRRNLNASPQIAQELGVEMVDLKTLLTRSDIVSLHLDLSDETYYLLDTAALGQMKPGALLINTSRGALVDETALVKALEESHLAGAGLDTFEQINVHTDVRTSGSSFADT